MEASAHVSETTSKRKPKSGPKASPPPAVSTPVTVSTDPLADILSKIASDPNATAEKIEKVFDLYARMAADRARRAFDAAMIDLQSVLPVIEEKGKTTHGSYAKLEDVIDAVRPLLTARGFSLTHRTEANTADKVRVTAILAHKDGHREENGLPLPFDTSDGKSQIHAESSAVSYGKRITALAILGIVTRGEDDDAKRASQSQEPETLSADQQRELLTLITESGADLDALLKMAKADSIRAVLVKDFPTLKAEIRAAKKARASLAKDTST